jgi:hypothetical protein
MGVAVIVVGFVAVAGRSGSLWRRRRWLRQHDARAVKMSTVEIGVIAAEDSPADDHVLLVPLA